VETPFINRSNGDHTVGRSEQNATSKASVIRSGIYTSALLPFTNGIILSDGRLHGIARHAN
jgi:hypothetical protein